jgi:hypothetical protein
VPLIDDVELFDRYCHWAEGKIWFISNLMMVFLFEETNPNKQILSADTKAITLDMIY